MELLLSVSAVLLTLGILPKAIRIFRKWRGADDEERYELEKDFYLAYSAVLIILGLRVFLVPLYFWTMQSFIPMIPGAMCLWGVFNALPDLAWPAVLLKFLLPMGYVGWFLVAKVNSESKTNPVMRNLMGFFLVLSPILLVDSAVDISIFLRMSPIEVSCCSNAIDVGQRPLPVGIGALSGQNLLLIYFLGLSTLFSLSLFLAMKNSIFAWASRVATIPLAILLVLTMTEVLAPWLLRLPFHHCPFCLLLEHPLSVVFVGLFWFALAAPWLTLTTTKLGRGNDESKHIEARTRRIVLESSLFAIIVAIALILVDTALVFAY